jgi:hypothetical protein
MSAKDALGLYGLLEREGIKMEETRRIVLHVGSHASAGATA